MQVKTMDLRRVGSMLLLFLKAQIYLLLLLKQKMVRPFLMTLKLMGLLGLYTTVRVSETI